MEKVRKTRIGKSLVFLLALATVCLSCALAASAEDLTWNLLTDKDAGYTAVNEGGNFTQASEEDGTLYVHNSDSHRAGAYYVYDYGNILGEYRSFSLEGDFYFEALPSGLRMDQNPPTTPNEMPLSFLAWCYKNTDTGAIIWNSIRISGDGQLYLANGKNAGSDPSGVYLEAGKWYNVKILMMPANGMCELYVNGTKEADFNIVRFDPKIHESYFVRYFDGFYDWSVKMKELIVKTDSSYIIGLREEEASDFIGYQVAKAEDGRFSLRAVMGVNSTGYNRIGYEVITLARDGEGKVVSDSFSQKAKMVYEAVKDNAGNTYNIKDLYGYSYAAALEIPELPEDPPYGSLEIVVRPYVLGMDGVRLYGKSAILLYSGETDGNGFPVLMRIADRFDIVLPTADTFIYKWANSGNNFGAQERLQIQNADVTNADPTQAAYFKFHFTPEQVKMIENSSSAKLCLYHLGMDSVELVVHGTQTDWDEMVITHDNHKDTAKTQEYITSATALDRQYVYFDVLRYLSEQMLNEDGSLTVSFRVTPQGEPNAKATYIESREKSAETTPKIEIVTTIYDVELGIRKISNIGYEPWGYAEYLVDQWFDELKDKIYPKDADGNLIVYDVNENVPDGYGLTEAAGDFTQVVEWDANNFIWVAPNYWADHPDGVLREDEWEKDRFARTLSTLGTSTANAYLTSEYAQTKSEYDIYGGIANVGFKGKDTGFFHTEIIGGRTYIIDPLGNPYFAVGVDEFVMYNHTYALERYGTEAAYYEATTKKLQEMGINTAHVSQKDKILAVEDGLSVVVDLSVVGAYMFSLGRSQISEGQFPHNNTINVFDPDFRKMTNKNVVAEITVGGYAENPRILGYTTDNELPGGTDILTRYLTLNTDEPSNAFSYAVAWTWLARKMNTPAPTLADYLESPDLLEMNSEFLGFIYATYYGVAREAIEAADPNHMYIGSRVASNCRFDEGYLRAAGYYLEVITTNLYTGLHFPWEYLINYYRYAGKPFLITEFYAKAMDAIDDHGFIMANSTGAGSVVKTQQERADYYEHQAMLLLESNACVGWTWYRMLDNDQPLHYSIDLKKEVVMAYVSYGQYPEARSFIDKEGNIYTAKEVNFFETVEGGDAMASNHNCNKGIFNRNFTSTVAVYSYDKDGKLQGSKSYWVEHPESAIPADGTVLRALDGSQTFTVGKATNADGSYTETRLTTFEGTYVALARAMRNISDNLIGLVTYFDAK